MRLLIDSHGQGHCVYGEEVNLTALGTLTIQRGSHVEPDAGGQWWADLSPVGGPKLGPYHRRSEALSSEQAWLEAHWLTQLPS